jgi:hypothetical protein
MDESVSEHGPKPLARVLAGLLGRHWGGSLRWNPLLLGAVLPAHNRALGTPRREIDPGAASTGTGDVPKMSVVRGHRDQFDVAARAGGRNVFGGAGAIAATGHKKGCEANYERLRHCHIYLPSLWTRGAALDVERAFRLISPRKIIAWRSNFLSSAFAHENVSGCRVMYNIARTQHAPA